MLNFVEKFNQCSQKYSVKEVIESFQEVSERQENKEIWAIYGAGSYSLATTYKSFQVDSAHWHSWDEETRKNHSKKMRSYTRTTNWEKTRLYYNEKKKTTHRSVTWSNSEFSRNPEQQGKYFCIYVNHLQQMSGDLHHPKLRTATISDFLTAVTINKKYSNFTWRNIYQNW